MIRAEDPAAAALRDEAEPSRPLGRLVRAARTATFGALLLVLAVAPLPLGSNRPLAWALLAVAAGAIALLAGLVAPIRPSRPLPLLLVPTGLLLAGVIGWITLQATSGPLPPSWAHPLWSEVAQVGLDVQPTLSVAPDLTSERLILLLAYIAVFGATLLLVSEPRRAHVLLATLLAVGVGYALWGLVVQLGRFEHMLPGIERLQRGRLHATFVNPNHYATYAVFGILTALAFLVERFRRRADRSRFAGVVAGLLDALTDRIGAALTASLLVLVAALLWTGSRGGLLALLAGMATLALVVGARSRPAVSVAVLGILVAGGWASSALFGETLAERLAGIGDEVAGGGGRAAIYALSLRLIGERPWLGYGYGTFERVFTMAREPEFHVVYDHAESSWLELVVDLGLPIAALFVLAMLLLAAMLLRGALRRRRDRVLPLAALAVAVAAGAHAMVDFSLQIPAVAVTFAAIAATGAAHVVPLRHMPPAGPAAIWTTARITTVLLGALLLMLAVPYARATWHLAVGDSAFRLVAADESVLPGVVERARASREAALAIHPTGRARKELGIVELYRARDPGLSWEQRQDALRRARAHLRSGLARDPADPDAWYRLALVETMRGRIEDAADALALSWRTGPWEPELAPARLRLALLHWPYLTGDARRRAGRELCAEPKRRDQLRTWAALAGLSAHSATLLSTIECAQQ